MANSLTNIAEHLALDWLNIVGNPARPVAPLKVALYTVSPNQETGIGGTEVTGGSYARTAVTFAAASNGSSINSSDVLFPTASASWGTVVAAGIYDSAVVPVLLWLGDLVVAKTVDIGDTFKIPAGSLTMTLD